MAVVHKSNMEVRVGMAPVPTVRTWESWGISLHGGEILMINSSKTREGWQG